MTQKNDPHLTPRMLKFLEVQRVTCKDSTISSYKISLRHFSQFLAQTIKTKRITKSHIKIISSSQLQSFIIHLNQKNLVPYTKVNYLLTVRLYLAWEADQNNLNPDVLDVLDRSRLPKVPEYLPRPLNAQNDHLIQNRFKQSNSPYALIFKLLRNNGLRISELVNLPWDPIVTNDKNEHFLKVPLGKMDNERCVPLNTESLELIKKIKNAYPIKLNKCDQSRLIGLRGSSSSVVGHLSYHFKKMTHDIRDQNKPVTFHRMRHSYATTLLTAGVSIVSIMKLLGHKRIEMTLRYTKVTPSYLRNEYLKAVTVIQNQVGLENLSTQGALSTQIHPVKLIEQLHAFTQKSVKLDPNKKRTLLQRLARLKKDLKRLQFKENFKISLPEYTK